MQGSVTPVCPELVEGLTFSSRKKEEEGFHRLSPNGNGSNGNAVIS
jgi:hypothetical protein